MLLKVNDGLLVAMRTRNELPKYLPVILTGFLKVLALKFKRFVAILTFAFRNHCLNMVAAAYQ